MAGIFPVLARAQRALLASFAYERDQRSIVALVTGPDLAPRYGGVSPACGERPLVAVEICSESDARQGRRPTAVTGEANAIRPNFEEDEPEALVFHDQAAPGALVSWAWGQLKALDALLCVGIDTYSPQDAETEFIGAVRTVLIPVINALEFSERRAADLQKALQSKPAAGRKSAGSRKSKKAKQ